MPDPSHVMKLHEQADDRAAHLHVTIRQQRDTIHHLPSLLHDALPIIDAAGSAWRTSESPLAAEIRQALGETDE